MCSENSNAAYLIKLSVFEVRSIQAAKSKSSSYPPKKPSCECLRLLLLGFKLGLEISLILLNGQMISLFRSDICQSTTTSTTMYFALYTKYYTAKKKINLT